MRVQTDVGLPSPQKTASLGPTDAALVVAARAGERWAHEALFRRYARMAGGLAFRLLGRDADVDDLVQDSFVAAMENLNRLDAPAAFSSWLGAIVIRTARKRLRRRALLTRLGLRRSTQTDLDQAVGARAPADAVLELRSVYAVLDRLPPDARVALVLHRVESMPLPEVAKAMGVSLSTAKRRLAVAERHLNRDHQGSEP